MVNGSSVPEQRTGTPGDALRGAEVDTADWPAQAADSIERLVGRVRDLTTGRAITAARALVYGTFALLVGLAVAVLVTIALVRGLDVALPDSVFGEDHVWAAHLILGGLFTILGMVLWARRTGGSAADSE
ncbi:MAG TPA: hypothetical protein VJ804_12950 [Acidimicrobiales bacterium]|nr:hypothetical protein [Acidimicrobiales bacterium]